MSQSSRYAFPIALWIDLDCGEKRRRIWGMSWELTWSRRTSQVKRCTLARIEDHLAHCFDVSPRCPQGARDRAAVDAVADQENLFVAGRVKRSVRDRRKRDCPSIRRTPTHAMLTGPKDVVRFGRRLSRHHARQLPDHGKMVC
jgi:hypothetical protein